MCGTTPVYKDQMVGDFSALEKKKKRKEFVRRGEQWEQPSPPNNSTSDKNQLDSLFWSKN